MDWNFSFGWFALGALILAVGTCITVFYQQIAEHLAASIPYDKIKTIGIIVAVIGMIIMANLHTLILSAFVSLVFKGFK